MEALTRSGKELEHVANKGEFLTLEAAQQLKNSISVDFSKVGDDLNKNFIQASIHRAIRKSQSDVVETILLLLAHLFQAMLEDYRQLIAIGRVIGKAIWNEVSHDMAMAILVLQALTIQRSTPRGRAQQEAPCLGITSRPDKVHHALETKHRVENIERHHRVIMVAIRCRTGHPCGERTSLINAFLQDLALFVLFVKHDLV